MNRNSSQQSVQSLMKIAIKYSRRIYKLLVISIWKVHFIHYQVKSYCKNIHSVGHLIEASLNPERAESRGSMRKGKVKMKLRLCGKYKLHEGGEPKSLLLQKVEYIYSIHSFKSKDFWQWSRNIFCRHKPNCQTVLSVK
jgi:hypothetical protein